MMGNLQLVEGGKIIFSVTLVAKISLSIIRLTFAMKPLANSLVVQKKSCSIYLVQLCPDLHVGLWAGPGSYLGSSLVPRLALTWVEKRAWSTLYFRHYICLQKVL